MLPPHLCPDGALRAGASSGFDFGVRTTGGDWRPAAPSAGHPVGGATGRQQRPDDNNATSRWKADAALVLCQAKDLGSRDFNFKRAWSIRNCQLTPRCLWLLATCQAVGSWRRVSRSPIRRPGRPWRVIELGSFSARFSFNRRVWSFSAMSNQRPCLGGTKLPPTNE